MKLTKVCVYCASSKQADGIYRSEANKLGEILAQHQITIVYGGGSVGSMGALAEGALTNNGTVIGVIPQFMVDLEWAHSKLSDLEIVRDMHERKKKMIENADAVIALPGGSGTLDELIEAITWKRLGMFLNPIIIVNTNGFYDPFIAQLEKCVSEKFMDSRHLNMWTIVDKTEDVIPAIQSSPSWYQDARHFAAV